MNSRTPRLFAGLFGGRFVPSFTLSLALMAGFGVPALAKSPETARVLAEQSALANDPLTGLLSALADAPEGTVMGPELRDAFREANLAETDLSKFLEQVGSIRKRGDQVEIRSMDGASLIAHGRGVHLEPLVQMRVRKNKGQVEVADLKGIKLSAKPESTRYPLNSAKFGNGADAVVGTLNVGPKGRAKDLKLRFPLPKAAPKLRKVAETKKPEAERPSKSQPNDLTGLVGALRGEGGTPGDAGTSPSDTKKTSADEEAGPVAATPSANSEERMNLSPGESVISLDGSKVEIPEGATHWSRGADFHVPEDGENPEGRGWLRLSPHANRVLGQDVPENATHYKPTVDFHGFDGPESNSEGTPELPDAPSGLPEAPSEPPSKPTSPSKPTAPSKLTAPSKPEAPNKAEPKLPKSNKPPGMICEGGVCRPRTAADDLPGGGLKLPGSPLSKKPGSSKPKLPAGPSQPTSPSDAPRSAPPPAAKPMGPPKDLQSAIARAKAEGKLILVDFYADWCGPCISMLRNSMPALERDPWVAENVFILKINIDHNKALAQQFGVRGIPDLRVLGVTSQGQVKALRRATGYQSAGAIRNMLQNAR
jgi:thiol-disulfide isomerase/thioredoxin